MNIPTTSPVEAAINRIVAALDLGATVLAEDQLPGYPAALAIGYARDAVAGLRAVLAALGDLEPGPALVIDDALRAGLGVSR